MTNDVSLARTVGGTGVLGAGAGLIGAGALLSMVGLAACCSAVVTGLSRHLGVTGFPLSEPATEHPRRAKTDGIVARDAWLYPVALTRGKPRLLGAFLAGDSALVPNSLMALLNAPDPKVAVFTL